MKHLWIKFALFICCSWMTACQTETVLQQIEEELEETNASALIGDNEVSIDGLRGIKSLKPVGKRDTATDENRGEKGRERRDSYEDLCVKFDPDAPPALLKAINGNESEDITMKLVFGLNYRKDEIEYAFEGRTLKISFIDKSDNIFNSFIIDNYHIGDTFSISAESFIGCYKIELYVGYFFVNAFWYVGEQLLESLFNN